MGNIILQAEGISIRRGARTILEPCSLTLREGEVVAIYGPNGAGKTTLLLAAAGLLPLAAGHVRFKGQTVGHDLRLLNYHRRTAAVFQEPLLLHGTVWHNVTLGLRLRGVNAAEQTRHARKWLERLKIDHLDQRPARTLSAGEAQRTSLARALVLNPELLFLDEPFAALDAPTRFRLVTELADILTERQIATLFVTHDLAEAFELSHRCLVLDQGRVLQEGGLPNIVRHPQSRRVAEITGAENILEMTVAAIDEQGTWLDWQGQPVLSSVCGWPVGSRVAVVIRQEDIQVRASSEPSPPNCLPARIEQIRIRGSHALVSLRLGNQQVLRATVAAPMLVMPGQAVHLAFAPDAVWVVPQGALAPSGNEKG